MYGKCWSCAGADNRCYHFHCGSYCSNQQCRAGGSGVAVATGLNATSTPFLPSEGHVAVFDPSTLSKPEGREGLAAAAPGVKVEGVKEDSAKEAYPQEESPLKKNLAEVFKTLRVNELVKTVKSWAAEESESDPESKEEPEQGDVSLLVEVIA